MTKLSCNWPKKGHLTLLIMTVIGILSFSVKAQTFVDGTEQLAWDSLMSEVTQPDKSLKKFMLTMHEDTPYDENNHLSITAFATSYDSDPDIFVQKRVSFEYFPLFLIYDFHRTMMSSFPSMPKIPDGLVSVKEPMLFLLQKMMSNKETSS